MNRRHLHTSLGVFTAILILVLAFLFAWQKRPRQWNWNPGYETRGRFSNQPYALGNLVSMFSNRNGKGRIISIDKPVKYYLDDKKNDGVYLYTGYYPYYSEEDLQSLLRFIRRGNTAFLAVNDLPEELIKAVGLQYDNENWSGFLLMDKQEITTTLPGLDPGTTYLFRYRVSDSLESFPWRYLNPDEFKSGDINGSSLGKLDNRFDCFYEFNIGEGKLLLHTNPVFFSNYYIITDKGFRYASIVFSFISPDKNVYFDHYSSKYINNLQSETSSGNDSWLGFIINAPGLQVAWTTLLLTAILFLIFRSRRRQSPIPVVEPNLNSSMEYMESVAGIYLRKKDYRSLALQMKQLFLMNLSINHKIRLNIPEKDFVQLVNARTGVPESVVSKIFTMASKIENCSSISKKSLIQWHNLLHSYYSYNK